nr:uncharacterized protein LOC113737597 [Coffea arabica]
MGNGQYADRHAGTIRRMRVVQNSLVIKFPDWLNSYTDEYNCYDARYRWTFLPEPEFYYGGPGQDRIKETVYLQFLKIQDSFLFQFTVVMGIKWMFVLMLQITLAVIGRGVLEKGSGSMQKFGPKFAVKSIQSEDGDVIDCIDIYKQPAFKHPALRNHKIQMTPAYDPTMVTKNKNEILEPFRNGREKDLHVDATPQLWQRSGSCPEGTIPIRRMPNNSKSKETPVDDHLRKKPSIIPDPFMESKNTYIPSRNKSLSMDAMNLINVLTLAILHAEGFAYYGRKGNIKVWNPSVELDDEYTTSQVALKSGPRKQYEAIESGWAVNPSVYGDRQTRLFTYWTVDGSVKTGCFDATWPGFVQVSKDIALGAAIYPISNPTGLPSQITIFIFKELFNLLSYHAVTVQRGGEVYSTRVGTHPHTATQMGSGQYSDWVSGNSSYIKRMRVIESFGALRFPDCYDTSYADEYDCYDTFYISESIADPEFYHGGPDLAVGTKIDHFQNYVANSFRWTRFLVGANSSCEIHWQFSQLGPEIIVLPG